MKLSRILELALVFHYGAHWSKHQFLCNAVETLERLGTINKSQRMAAVQYIVGILHWIYPAEQTYCMVTSLNLAGYVPTNVVEDHIEYITQLYVWMIFDLKNKGL